MFTSLGEETKREEQGCDLERLRASERRGGLLVSIVFSANLGFKAEEIATLTADRGMLIEYCQEYCSTSSRRGFVEGVALSDRGK